jgi:hypothetical protein
VSGRAGNLYEEAQAVRMLAAELEGEDLELSIASETGFVEAAEQVLSAIRDAEMLRDAAHERAKAINDRAALFDRRQERLRDVLLGAMATAGQRKLVLAEGTLSVCDTAPTAIVTDEARLPPELVTSKITTRPDMREITRRLRAGEEILGAELRNAPPRLTVRVR